MGFIRGFGGAMMVLRSIRKGTIAGEGRASWIKNIKYALKTKTNPLKLTAEERKKLKAEIKALSGKRIAKKGPRPSPTVSATKNCGKKMRGNDGNMYVSKPNKNGVCRWVKVTKK
jgi:hypothetical protein